MEEFEAEVGEREEPAKERHGPREVVVRNSVEATGAFEQREIVSYQAGCE